MNSDSQNYDEKVMNYCIDLSIENVEENIGGPFGSIVVKDNKIIGTGTNTVIMDHDPSAHAEVNAIRDACKTLKTHDLSDCILYTSCEPCPMCLSCIYWANINKCFYVNDRKDAAKIGFSDEFIYNEFKKDKKSIQLIKKNNESAIKAFKLWEKSKDKISY